MFVYTFHLLRTRHMNQSTQDAMGFFVGMPQSNVGLKEIVEDDYMKETATTWDNRFDAMKIIRNRSQFTGA